MSGRRDRQVGRDMEHYGLVSEHSLESVDALRHLGAEQHFSDGARDMLCHAACHHMGRLEVTAVDVGRWSSDGKAMTCEVLSPELPSHHQLNSLRLSGSNPCLTASYPPDLLTVFAPQPVSTPLQTLDRNPGLSSSRIAASSAAGLRCI